MEQQILAAAGFDLTWLQEVGAKYGSTIYQVIGDLLNQGFSVAWVISTVDRLHPLMMDVLYKVFAIPSLASAKLGASADGLANLASALDGQVSKDMLIFLVEKALLLLPMVGLTGWKLLVVENGLKVLLSFLKSQ
jgi:hypothetical protein